MTHGMQCDECKAFRPASAPSSRWLEVAEAPLRVPPNGGWGNRHSAIGTYCSLDCMTASVVRVFEREAADKAAVAARDAAVGIV